MTNIRLAIAWALATALAAIGIRGVVLTHDVWTPCAGNHFTDTCLVTMDSPGHMPTLASLWILSLMLAVAAGFVLRSRVARVLGLSAAGVVLLMNGGTDYMISLGVAGGHHDVPPGTGYPMVLAFVLAGILVGAGALLDTKHNRPAAHTQEPTSSVAASASAYSSSLRATYRRRRSISRAGG